jgi:hypothetical protein
MKNNRIEEKKLYLKRLRKGSRRHTIVSEMIGKWSSMVVNEYDRSKSFLNIQGVTPSDRHLLSKSEQKYILQYADEKEYLGGGIYNYHFTKMELLD